GSFSITKETVIVPGDPSRASDMFAVRLLNEEIRRRLGFNLKISQKLIPGKSIAVGLATDAAVAELGRVQGLDPRDVNTPEGYELSIGSNGIVLAGVDTDGTFYAVQTLRQILRGDRRGAALPTVKVLDWPVFHFRGITDDISRGPIPTMDTVKQTIRRLSELKINKFNFYIEHVFEFKKHPLIGPAGGAITADQMREIDAYAKKYHVELVGGLQSFGHQANILKHKKYAFLSENPINPWVLTPARKETYELLDDLYSEIAPTFNSALFNVSCDETYGLGQGQSRKLVEKHGLAWVYARHINRINDLLAKRGKRIMMWADIALKHPDIISMIPENVIFLPWAYDARDSFDDMLEPIRSSGHEFIVCPGVNCWSRMFPNTKVASVNIGNFARDGAKYGALGLLNTTWDDDGENLFGYNWQPVAWGAESSWNPGTADLQRFSKSFSQAFYATNDGAVSLGVDQLSSASQLTDYANLSDSYYWDWPAWTRFPGYKSGLADAERLLKYSRKAESFFINAKKTATENTDNLEFLIFSARRIEDLAFRRIAYMESAAAYRWAYENQSSGRNDEVLAALDKIKSDLDAVYSGVDRIEAAYRKVWAMENRPYWLEKNIEKFDGLKKKVGDSRSKFLMVYADFKKTGLLPVPEEVGLSLPGAAKK
ncbi:MAG TPA: beta-N-acetylhexosaminidase, partial [bacterium]|nr:beta-N-acetylhexosaminidase [bacterium]